jgi:hypothetical protein
MKKECIENLFLVCAVVITVIIIDKPGIEPVSTFLAD